MQSAKAIIPIGVLLAVASGCSAGMQGTSTTALASADCAGISSDDSEAAGVYAPGRASNARPVYGSDFRARALQSRYIAGAQFDVPAPANGSAAYLERALSCHARGGVTVAQHPNDPLRVAGVEDVDVEAIGTRMRVTVTSTNRAAGTAILERTRAMIRGGGSVDVQQLSAAPSVTAEL